LTNRDDENPQNVSAEFGDLEAKKASFTKEALV
jgi:hypothetical protein